MYRRRRLSLYALSLSLVLFWNNICSLPISLWKTKHQFSLESWASIYDARKKLTFQTSSASFIWPFFFFLIFTCVKWESSWMIYRTMADVIRVYLDWFPVGGGAGSVVLCAWNFEIPPLLLYMFEIVPLAIINWLEAMTLVKLFCYWQTIGARPWVADGKIGFHGGNLYVSDGGLKVN